ncbi:MAG: hypothetical protein V3T18_06075, partial [Pseudomonadales bacterium]
EQEFSHRLCASPRLLLNAAMNKPLLSQHPEEEIRNRCGHEKMAEEENEDDGRNTQKGEGIASERG